MRKRIAFYRGQPDDPREDYRIGCRVLAQPFFFPEDQWIPIPASFSLHIQQGRRYSTEEQDGRLLWEAVMERVAQEPTISGVASRCGERRLIQPRLGQVAFRLTITDVYRRSCAVTGEKTLPILEAAHIRPYKDGGMHEVSNGLLLRSDIHRLFDLGYVTISTDGRFEVGRRLKDDYENGRHYYAMHRQSLSLPGDPLKRPAREALEWHQSNTFLG
jgi:putative restriction endonuclease